MNTASQRKSVRSYTCFQATLVFVNLLEFGCAVLVLCTMSDILDQVPDQHYYLAALYHQASVSGALRPESLAELSDWGKVDCCPAAAALVLHLRRPGSSQA